MYWSPATGAHALRGAVLYRWHGLGGVRGPLGFPTSDERTAADGRGRWSAFTGGQVWWSPTTGAHDVRGAVLRRWQALGAERGGLGYPRAGELATSDGRGRYSRFSGGSVYWSPDTGAHEVRGAIRRTWTDLGAERSALRLPVSGERSAGDGRGRNDFQRGSVYWSPTTGAHEVRGAVRTRWLALGGVRGRLGYPVGDEVGVEAGQLSRFEHGWILWDRTTGKITVRYL